MPSPCFSTCKSQFPLPNPQISSILLIKNTSIVLPGFSSSQTTEISLLKIAGIKIADIKSPIPVAENKCRREQLFLLFHELLPPFVFASSPQEVIPKSKDHAQVIRNNNFSLTAFPTPYKKNPMKSTVQLILRSSPWKNQRSLIVTVFGWWSLFGNKSICHRLSHIQRSKSKI